MENRLSFCFTVKPAKPHDVKIASLLLLNFIRILSVFNIDYAIKLTAFKYRNFVCQASKYCLKCGNVVHFADSVINVML